MTTTEPGRITADVLSVSTVIATLAGWLPPIAAGLSIIWLVMQMWGWVINRRWRRRES